MRLTTAVFTSIALVLGVATTASLALPNPLASILSPGAQTVPASIVSCGSPEDILSIDYIKISPESPARGKNLTIEAHGVLSEEIKEGAYMKIVVKLGLIKLLQKEFDFCEESQKVDKPCPLAAGDQYLQHTVELPKEIPPGRYNVHILVYNYDDEPITCLDAKAEFKIIPKFGL